MKSAATMNTPTPIQKEQDVARRKKRSIAIALILAALVVLFYVVTLVQFGNLLGARGS